MKKALSFLLCALLLLGSVSALAAPLKIGVVTPDADHGFTGESIAHARAELEAQVAQLGADNLSYMFEVGGEAAKQIAAIETILTWAPDVIVLWPLEGEQLRNAAMTVVDEGVGLVVYDRLIEGFEGLDAEIMGDNETIGRWMGEYILRYFDAELAAGETLSYLQFIGDSSTVSLQRTGGMMESFAASPYAAQLEQVRASFQTDWSNAKSQEQLENWLTTADPAEIERIDFIVTHDDEIVDGLMIVLENMGAQNIRLITSVGGRRETLATFDESALGIDLVTYFFSPSFIREAIRLGIADAQGEPYMGQPIEGQLFLIESFEIDKHNVDDFRLSDVFIERYSLDN